MTDRTLNLDQPTASAPASEQPSAAAPALTGLDALTAALAETIPTPTVTIKVTARPGWAVQYRTNESWDDVTERRGRAVNDKGVVDRARLSRLILAETCLGFARLVGGEWVLQRDPSGELLTFGHVAKQQGITAADAVSSWLVLDGEIEEASELVYAQAGYGRVPEVVDGDPT